MEKTRDQVMEQVQKLLKRTETSGCSQAEAELALAQASRLLAQYNLDIAEVEAHQGRETSFVEAEVCKERDVNLEGSLATHVAQEFFFVRCYKTQRRDAKTGLCFWHVIFFGTPDNTDTAIWVYRSLRSAFNRLWVEYWREAPQRARCKPAEVREERRAFVTGVAHGFSAKLRADRRALQREQEVKGKGTALARLADKVEQAFRAAHTDLVPGRAAAQAQGSYQAYAAGEERGRNLQLAERLATEKRLALGK